jgi:CDP-6-deoxy-D-xylo-4-hexulose-3-dehydrase
MRAKRSHGMSREMDKEERLKYEAENIDIDPAFLFPTEGYNFRNNELGAVLGSVQLKKLDDFIQKRQDNYYDFYMAMVDHPWIKHLPNPYGNSAMTLPFHCDTASHRNELIRVLRALGVETRPFLVGNLLRQPFMKDYKKTPYLPNSEEIHTNAFYIGNNHFITKENVFDLSRELYKCAA